MPRPSFDEVAFNIARDVAKRSTCPRLHTGAVICTADNRVLATGYNGSLPGTPHCDEVLSIDDCPTCSGTRAVQVPVTAAYQDYNWHAIGKKTRGMACPDCRTDLDNPTKATGRITTIRGCLMIEGHCRRTMHAEANAIVQAAKYGIPIYACKLYSLHRPCLACTQLIIACGLSLVVASNYRNAEVDSYLDQLGYDRATFELNHD